MLIGVQRLVARLRSPDQPASRLADIAELRTRLLAEPPPESVPGAERTAAARVRSLADELSRVLADSPAVQACASCATGRPLPHGQWAGGFCCGGPTAGVFTDAELAALRLGGTTPARLTPPPPTDHAGCAFRGPTGCSLAAKDRPSICVHYVCRELSRALAASGELDRVTALGESLAAAFAQFSAIRQQRLDDDEWRALI